MQSSMAILLLIMTIFGEGKTKKLALRSKFCLNIHVTSKHNIASHFQNKKIPKLSQQS